MIDSFFKWKEIYILLEAGGKEEEVSNGYYNIILT